MASLLSHPAVPLGIALAAGSSVVSPRLSMAAVVCSILPDLDVLAFGFGLPYAHPFGHRGFSHSLTFSLLVAAVGCLFARKLDAGTWTAFLVLFVSTASHGVLDALTNGGLGIGFFSPFSHHRYFFPWRVIEVSPIGIAGFFSPWGLRVIASELLYVWLPCLVVGFAGLALRRWR